MKITINATTNIIVPTKRSIIHGMIVITLNNSIQIARNKNSCSLWRGKLRILTRFSLAN